MKIWITGTGTGVGKTLLTTLLTLHLRQNGNSVFAIKPYVSGSFEDTEILEWVNEFELSKEDISPIFCPKPLSPLAGLTKKNAIKGVEIALKTIRTIEEQCDILLIEGIGGVAVPIAPNITVGHIIAETASKQIVVGQNKLGILNDLSLSNFYLKELCDHPILNVLMKSQKADLSSQSNAKLLKIILRFSTLLEFPFLGTSSSKNELIKKSEKKVKKKLEEISKWINVSSPN